jgi:dinuclear metal center YbgI/SA1388 family protein
MNRNTLVNYLDEYLRVREIEDSSDNGLQVEGAGEVGRVAFAVDACRASFEAAVEARAHMLVVHHGLFWGRVKRLVGPHYRRVKTLLDGGVSLYACHLPLDAHAQVGNNVELARLLGIEGVEAFGDYHGQTVGAGGLLEPPLPLADLVNRIKAQFGPPLRVHDFGPDVARRVALVSGGAMTMVDQVAEAGYDTFVTGETTHTFYHDIREYGLNVICAGHYATETVGLKALARHLEEQFNLETIFIDLPTGA